LRFTLRSIV